MNKHPRHIQAIHWVVLAIVTLLTTLLIVAPIILVLLTKTVYFYTFLSTAGLIPIAYARKCMLHYFFPKEPQDYELEKEKI
jgi:hypothetical protein